MSRRCWCGLLLYNYFIVGPLYKHHTYLIFKATIQVSCSIVEVYFSALLSLYANDSDLKLKVITEISCSIPLCRVLCTVLCILHACNIQQSQI